MEVQRKAFSFFYRKRNLLLLVGELLAIVAVTVSFLNFLPFDTGLLAQIATLIAAVSLSIYAITFIRMGEYPMSKDFIYGVYGALNVIKATEDRSLPVIEPDEMYSHLEKGLGDSVIGGIYLGKRRLYRSPRSYREESSGQP